MFQFLWNHHQAVWKNTDRYIELLKHVMGSEMFTTNLCSQCMSLFPYYSIWISVFRLYKTLKPYYVYVLCFMWVCVYKMLLIGIIKTIITLQHYRIRCVLSSLCFGIALVEVFPMLAVWIVLLTLELWLYYVFRTVFTIVMCPVLHLCWLSRLCHFV